MALSLPRVYRHSVTKSCTTTGFVIADGAITGDPPLSLALSSVYSHTSLSPSVRLFTGPVSITTATFTLPVWNQENETWQTQNGQTDRGERKSGSAGSQGNLPREGREKERDRTNRERESRKKERERETVGWEIQIEERYKRECTQGEREIERRERRAGEREEREREREDRGERERREREREKGEREERER
ncbi:hypothetical protein WMY93_014231 [Mugilogobius chulae]|uniref:Uncharacterized protein n=1 Tax=Mugilogobius chulae TaxID=88201 RepID=A0AAW0P0Y3_9GOBI